MKWLRFVLTILFCLPWTSLGLINEDGRCTVFLYAPFTHGGGGDVRSCYETEDNETLCSSWGFDHMAAALIAVEHFNNRVSTVFQELSDFVDCPIQLELKVFDSECGGHAAARSLAQATVDGQTPCAIAGPFSDQPALELGTLALAHQIPLVAHRAFNNRVASQSVNPYSSQVFPDLHATSETLVALLLAMNRTDFISIIHPATDTGSQRKEIFTETLQSKGMRSFDESYQVPHDYKFEQLLESMTKALEAVKEREFRTIVVSLEDPAASYLIPLAYAADNLGMNKGEYLWIWLGQMAFFEDVSEHEEVLDKIMAGSAWLAAGENYFLDPQDPFLLTWYYYRYLEGSWNKQNSSMLDLLNQINPVSPDNKDYIWAAPDFFNHQPEWGSGLAADAVMSIGMGACLAAAKQSKDNTSAIISGQDHLWGIRNVSFHGASGDMVRFSSHLEDRPGTRDPTTSKWAAFNFLSGDFLYSDLAGFRDGLDEWEMIAPFRFRGNTTTPPLLRDVPEQNYLSRPLQVFGLVLMMIAILLGLITIVWVFIHRKHTVLLAAQPYFLYLIAFGSILFALSILGFSFDESSGWSEDKLSRGCVVDTWFASIGYILIYGGLYSKLYRVNRVLQFSRRRVGFWRDVLPFAIMLGLTVLSLALTTAFDPAYWERWEIDEDTGESVGRCRTGSDGIVALMMLLVTILAGVSAWKTRDVDTAYSDAWWIGMLILMQIEVCVVGIPIVIILEDVNTNGYYFGMLILTWFFPMSTLLLIMLPKVAAFRKADHPDHRRNARGSIGHGGVCVSGLPSSSASRQVAGVSGSREVAGSSGSREVAGSSCSREVAGSSTSPSPFGTSCTTSCQYPLVVEAAPQKEVGAAKHVNEFQTQEPIQEVSLH